MRTAPWALAIGILAGGALVAGADATADALQALESGSPAEKVAGAGRLAVDRAPARREAILDALGRHLTDPWPDVRRAVALALGRRGDRRAAGLLADRLPVEQRPDVLAALLLGVGDLGGSEHVACVVPFATRHALPSVRAAAVTALGHLGGEAARTVVLETIATPGLPDLDWSLRAAGVLALARCGRPEDVGVALVAYREGAGEGHWFARSALARLVATLDPDPVPLLRRLVGDSDPRVAVTAAEGLARAGHPDELLRLLGHVVPSVRAAAASGAAQANLEAALPRLRSMARLDAAREVRWAAALALFRLEDADGDALVLEGLRAREPAIWMEALAALADRTGEWHGLDRSAWHAALVRWRRTR